ncbi:MAG TPA: hypothetical protein VK034_21775 [Enhygromyxa sp.]|nr:hypothetical protein [Enhygromyxa sp.]
MTSVSISRLSVLALAVTLAGSACSRELPSQWPTGSPASGDAAEAPTAVVTLALDGDPPLPGEPADGWIGLEQAPSSDDPHAHHRHHQGHAMPKSSEGHEGHEGHAMPKSSEGHEGHGGHDGH